MDYKISWSDDITTCWVGTRIRENIDIGDRYPEIIAFVNNREEVYFMMLRLAGLDQMKAELCGLHDIDPCDPFAFCDALKAATNGIDTFTICPYETLASSLYVTQGEVRTANEYKRQNNNEVLPTFSSALTVYKSENPEVTELWIITRSRNDSEELDYEFCFAQNKECLPEAIIHASGIKDYNEIRAEIDNFKKLGHDPRSPTYIPDLRKWARGLTGDDYQIMHGNFSGMVGWTLTRYV